MFYAPVVSRFVTYGLNVPGFAQTYMQAVNRLAEKAVNVRSEAREAYRKQFDIGQRTLLDLLDTENEFFQARRTYTVTERDTRERMMSNGGADLMGIQSQLMVNYSALSLAFSAARNLSNPARSLRT